jgi:hypothetical protein
MNIESSERQCQGVESYPIYPQGYAQVIEWLEIDVRLQYSRKFFTFTEAEIFSWESPFPAIGNRPSYPQNCGQCGQSFDRFSVGLSHFSAKPAIKVPLS